jgi:hypothetical protein
VIDLLDVVVLQDLENIVTPIDRCCVAHVTPTERFRPPL